MKMIGAFTPPTTLPRFWTVMSGFICASKNDGKDQLTTFPPEVHLRIFDFLQKDAVTAICLGLTCKKLYKIACRRVRLHCCIIQKCGKSECRCKPLHILLLNWVPQGLVFDHFAHKFVALERKEEFWKEFKREHSGWTEEEYRNTNRDPARRTDLTTNYLRGRLPEHEDTKLDQPAITTPQANTQVHSSFISKRFTNIKTPVLNKRERAKALLPPAANLDSLPT
ncbi:hypothetical protein G7Y89_g7034 [Cudoniella acicularis]|uniref:F-box domain-containing protein n=1 Tax=Cudoniella acicularis TaxID=354080 RepID=A0A8H4W4Y0_9HELO|nr:hypothetical protein G7Y89_g7034 [Cudoniella acicularis]